MDIATDCTTIPPARGSLLRALRRGFAVADRFAADLAYDDPEQLSQLLSIIGRARNEGDGTRLRRLAEDLDSYLGLAMTPGIIDEDAAQWVQDIEKTAGRRLALSDPYTISRRYLHQAMVGSSQERSQELLRRCQAIWIEQGERVPVSISAAWRDTERIQVTLTLDGQKYVDTVDPASGFQRQELIRRAAASLQVSPEGLEFLHTELPRLAELTTADGPADDDGESEDGEGDASSQDAAEVADNGPADDRDKLVRFIRRGIGHPGFIGAIQYGTDGAAYELLFDTDHGQVGVAIRSTATLLSRAQTNARFLERLKSEIKANQKAWPKYAQAIIKLAEVRQGVDDAELLDDLLRSYVRDDVSPFTYSVKDVLASIDDPDSPKGRWAAKNVKSFFDSEGRLYVKWLAFKSWLEFEHIRLPDDRLAPGTWTAWLPSAKVKAAHNGVTHEERYWVHDDGRRWRTNATGDAQGEE